MSKAMAYGGVIFDAEGCILLRKPTNNHGGYAWTFAKGRHDPGASPDETALREVQEETGVTGEILGKVPGAYEGDVTITEFFLMRPLSHDKFGWETEEIRWVTPEEARELIAETPNEKGRERDLKILAAAVEAFQQLKAK